MGQQPCSTWANSPICYHQQFHSKLCTLCYCAHSPPPPVSHWVFGCGDSRHCPPAPGSLSPRSRVLPTGSPACELYVKSNHIKLETITDSPDNQKDNICLHSSKSQFPIKKVGTVRFILHLPINSIGSNFITNDIPFNYFNWAKYGLMWSFGPRGLPTLTISMAQSTITLATKFNHICGTASALNIVLSIN